MKPITIGSFEIGSGRVVVSDPCYELKTWCQGILENVRNGTWHAHVWSSESRVYELIASHEAREGIGKAWTEESFEVGVDSGQAGIFDAVHYRDDSVVAGIERVHGEVIGGDEPW